MIEAGWWLQSGGETEVLGCGGDGEAEEHHNTP